jgi:hypothetical protein
MCLPVYRLFWVLALAYPNLLRIKGYVVVVVVVVVVAAEKILDFPKLFYDSTFVLSDVYYLTNPFVLHHILEIASHLHACERDQNLRVVVAPMKLKFLKYWENIPLLYSYAFILDPRAKIR